VTQKSLIMIVDDEESIRSALVTFLNHLGYVTEDYATGEDAIRRIQDHVPDLILLDVVLSEDAMSGMSGIEVCRVLREREKFIPIIMLTSYPEWQVESLGQGAIAFITKPWDNNMLATQIRSTLSAVNRIRQETRPTSATYKNSQIIIGELDIDLVNFRASYKGEQISFTPIEFSVLAFLARNPDRQWTREALLNNVWDYSWDGYERTVDRHIAAIRRKLKLRRNELIETVHGVGYRLVSQ